MTIEGNKEAVRILVKEVFENKKIELLNNILHDDFQTGELGDHGVAYRYHHHDKSEMLANAKLEVEFRDRSYEILDMIGDNDKVVAKVDQTALWLKGEFSKGKTTKYLVIYIFYFRDGKVVRWDEIYDKWTRYEQLGVTERMVDSITKLSLKDYIDQLDKEGYL